MGGRSNPGTNTLDKFLKYRGPRGLKYTMEGGLTTHRGNTQKYKTGTQEGKTFKIKQENELDTGNNTKKIPDHDNLSLN